MPSPFAPRPEHNPPPEIEDLARRLYTWSGGIWWDAESAWKAHHREESRQWFAYADLLTRLADLEAPRPVTVTEYGLRAADGTIHTGEDEGLRWTRDEALVAADADTLDDEVDESPDVLIRRKVVRVTERVGGWRDA